MTTYVVLSRNGSGNGQDGEWTVIGRVDASGDVAAIRAAVELEAQGVEGETTGDFVAVPARSFHVRRAETRTTVAFVEVKE